MRFHAVPCESASEILLALGRLSADAISGGKYEKEGNVGKKVKKGQIKEKLARRVN